MSNDCFQTLENKQGKTMVPEKRDTSNRNSTIILLSCLDIICVSLGREGSQAKQRVSMTWGDRDKSSGKQEQLEFVGWRSRGRSYREKDLQKFAWGPLEYVTNKVSQKNMAQLHKGRQKMTQGLLNSTIPRTQTGLSNVLSWKQNGAETSKI